MLPSAFLFLPLYIYPTDDSWSPIYNSLSANPSLNFTIIVNPDSGPGAAPYPEDDYITAVAKLNAYPNANVLGYVHVLSTDRSISEVESDIDTYAGWSTYSESNIQVDGIFFDEAPNDYSSATYSYMRNVAAHARAALPASSPSVTFNPGTVVDNRFFTLADNIVVFEDYADNFDAIDSLAAVPKSVRSKSSIILHDFDGDSSDLTSTVKAVHSAGIPGLFISSAEYDSWGDDWDGFVAEMANVY